MKILFTLTYIGFPSVDGRATSLIPIANSLAENGQDVHILSTEEIRWGDFEQDGVKYHIVKAGDRAGLLRLSKRFSRLLGEIKPDIVVYRPGGDLGFKNLFNVVYLRLMTKLYNRPLVLYLWGGFPLSRFSFLFSKILSPVADSEIKCNYEILPPIVNTKNCFRHQKNPEFLKAIGIKNEKVALFANGSRNYSRHTLDYILHDRGLLDIIKAVQILNNEKRLKVLICVPCLFNGKGRKEITKILDEHRVTDKFIILGTIENMRELMATVDCYLFPLSMEDKAWLPFSILESLGCGTPVISSKHRLAQQIIIDHKNGLLVQARQPYELANAINSILNDSGIRKKLVEEGLRLVKERYSYNVVTGKALEIFRSVVNNQ